MFAMGKREQIERADRIKSRWPPPFSRVVVGAQDITGSRGCPSPAPRDDGIECLRREFLVNLERRSDGEGHLIAGLLFEVSGDRFRRDLR